jgi:hypothetical protein
LEPFLFIRYFLKSALKEETTVRPTWGMLRAEKCHRSQQQQHRQAGEQWAGSPPTARFYHQDRKGRLNYFFGSSYERDFLRLVHIVMSSRTATGANRRNGGSASKRLAVVRGEFHFAQADLDHGLDDDCRVGSDDAVETITDGSDLHTPEL